MIYHPKDLILTKVEPGITLRKAASFFNFVVFWTLTLYLLRSTFYLVGWLGAYLVLGAAIRDAKIMDIGYSLLTVYFPLVLAATFGLLAWASYNRIRYGGERDKRRVHPPALTVEEVSAYTGLDRHSVESMRHAKGIICYFDDRDELDRVECFDRSLDSAYPRRSPSTTHRFPKRPAPLS